MKVRRAWKVGVLAAVGLALVGTILVWLAPFLRSIRLSRQGISIVEAIDEEEAVEPTLATPVEELEQLPRVLAVAPLDSYTGYSSHDWMRTAFAEVLASRLTGTPNLSVLETRRLAIALRGPQGQVPDHLAPEAAIQAAETLGAELVLTGSFRKAGERLTCELEFFSVADGVSLGRFRSEGSFEEPWELLNGLAAQSLSRLKLSPAPAQKARLTARAARDRYALTLFGRGLNAYYGVGTGVDLARADGLLQRASTIDPDQPIFYYARGMLALESGRADLALGLQFEALKLWPDFPNAHRQMANLLEQRGRLDEACEHLASVLSVEPEDVQCRYQRARLLARLDRRSESLGELERVLRGGLSKADEKEALLLQARLRAAEGDLEGMAVSSRRLLRLEPAHSEARLNLASYALRKGELEEAEDLWQGLSDQRTTSVVGTHFLGELSLEKNDPESAVERFTREANLANTRGHPWRYVSEAYHRQRLDQAAVQAETQSLEHLPGDPTVLNNLAVAHLEAGEVDDAVQILRQALTRTPGYALLYQNLALALERRGDEAGALEAASQGLLLQPTHPELQYIAGCLLTRAGRLEEAQRAFEQATASSPTRPEAWYNLGAILEGRGDLVGAKRALEQYLKLELEPTKRKEVEARIASMFPG